MEKIFNNRVKRLKSIPCMFAFYLSFENTKLFNLNKPVGCRQSGLSRKVTAWALNSSLLLNIRLKNRVSYEVKETSALYKYVCKRLVTSNSFKEAYTIA